MWGYCRKRLRVKLAGSQNITFNPIKPLKKLHGSDAFLWRENIKQRCAELNTTKSLKNALVSLSFVFLLCRGHCPHRLGGNDLKVVPHIQLYECLQEQWYYPYLVGLNFLVVVPLVFAIHQLRQSKWTRIETKRRGRTIFISPKVVILKLLFPENVALWGLKAGTAMERSE